MFRELTSARVTTPWIEALRRKEKGLEVNEVVADTKEAKEKSYTSIYSFRLL